jgi:hypothetical protein
LSFLHEPGGTIVPEIYTDGTGWLWLVVNSAAVPANGAWLNLT